MRPLVRLSEMGFVTVLPGRGYTVTKLSWQQIKALFEARCCWNALPSSWPPYWRRRRYRRVEGRRGAAQQKSQSNEGVLDVNLRFHAPI